MFFDERLLRAARSRGSAKALLYRDTYLSWRGLSHRARRRASELSSLGVRPGDIVGLMLGNVPDMVILTMALAHLDAAAMPLDPTSGARELEVLMAQAAIRALITRPRGGDAPLPGGGGGDGPPPHAVLSRRRLQGTLLTATVYDVAERRLPRRKADRVAAVLVSTDSAGDPRPVERTAANLEAEARHVAAALGLDTGARVLLTLPLHGAFGFDCGLVGCVAAGATLYIEDEVAASRVARLIREQRVTVLPGSATLVADLARLPSARPYEHGPLRVVIQGAGLPASTRDRLRQQGAETMVCYHNPETGTVAAGPMQGAGRSVGRPVADDIEVAVRSPKSGKPVAPGRTGALWVRSPAVSPLALAPRTAPEGVPVGGKDAEGWFRTGDLAAVDKQGRITLRSREDDLVRLDGKRVALGEVEGCIEAMPGVSAARAEVVTDPLGGPMVVARVVPRSKRAAPPAEAIIEHCARSLAPYKVPRRVELCDRL